MVARERGNKCHPCSAVLMAALSLLLGFSCLSASGPPRSRAGAPGWPAASIPEHQDDEPVWVAGLRLWRAAVEDHRPGTVDAPVVGINGWSRQELMNVVNDLVSLRDLLASAHAKRSQMPGSSRLTVRYNERTFNASDVEALLGLTADEAARADVNRLLKRGAILHSDVATLVPPDVSPISTFASQAVRNVDGRARGFEGTVHWDVARKLLDGVTPDRSRDAFVRSWYHATAALQLRDSQLAYANPHLEHARQIFPGDPVFLFDSGCLHEAYASPLVQAVVRSVAGLNVGGVAANWQRAERFFRQALAADSSLTEARVRLGRVVGLLGRHQEAVTELQRAIPDAGDSRLRYYVEMFLGSEEQALGHGEAARGHYERATEIYPSAQSPYLALSQLGRQDRNRAAALDAIQHVFTATAGLQHREDPWWDYVIAPFGNAEELLARCRSEFQTEKKQ